MRDSPESWKKPWTKEQCRDRYVKGDEIGLRALAKESGVPKGTVERWARDDPNGKWVDQRRQYKDNLQTKTTEKTIEKVSDRLSDEWAELATQHFEGCKIYRDLAVMVGSLLKEEADRLKEHPENAEAILKKLNPITINFWSLVLDRSIKGERIATNMEYLDKNRVAEAAAEMGFVLVPKDDSILAQYVVGEVPQESQIDPTGYSEAI